MKKIQKSTQQPDQPLSKANIPIQGTADQLLLRLIKNWPKQYIFKKRGRNYIGIYDPLLRRKAYAFIKDNSIEITVFPYYGTPLLKFSLFIGSFFVFKHFIGPESFLPYLGVVILAFVSYQVMYSLRCASSIFHDEGKYIAWKKEVVSAIVHAIMADIGIRNEFKSKDVTEWSDGHSSAGSEYLYLYCHLENKTSHSLFIEGLSTWQENRSLDKTSDITYYRYHPMGSYLEDRALVIAMEYNHGKIVYYRYEKLDNGRKELRPSEVNTEKISAENLENDLRTFVIEQLSAKIINETMKGSTVKA